MYLKKSTELFVCIYNDIIQKIFESNNTGIGFNDYKEAVLTTFPSIKNGSKRSNDYYREFQNHFAIHLVTK